MTRREAAIRKRFVDNSERFAVALRRMHLGEKQLRTIRRMVEALVRDAQEIGFIGAIRRSEK